MEIDKTALRGWPADSDWSDALPDWFIAKCAPELSQAEADAELEGRKKLPLERQSQFDEEHWSLLNWIYWFQPANRHWFWWDAENRDENTIEITLEVEDWPFPWGAFAWLFRAAGATQVTSEAENFGAD